MVVVVGMLVVVSLANQILFCRIFGRVMWEENRSKERMQLVLF